MHFKMRRASGSLFQHAVAAILLLFLSGCTSTYYKAMSTFGREKRDILVSRVQDAKKDQQQTKEQIKTTMESFEALTGFQGGSLEKQYKRLNSEYEKSQDQANKLHDRIESINKVSSDLFKEWQQEINSMGNKSLRAQSSDLLRDSRIREGAYLHSMRQTEDQMVPVLKAFHDQVLFLKHNLNARAIGSLKSTTVSIQNDVTVLMASMDSSMKQADSLIDTLSTEDEGKDK